MRIIGERAAREGCCSGEESVRGAWMFVLSKKRSENESRNGKKTTGNDCESMLEGFARSG